MTQPGSMYINAEHIGCLFQWIRYFWCCILNHPLDNALAKTANIISFFLQNVDFYIVEDLQGQGLFRI